MYCNLKNFVKIQVGNKRLKALQSISKLCRNDGVVSTEKQSAAP